MSLFRIDKYRDIYIKYDRIPYQRLTGNSVMYYTGRIITNVKGIPDGYDRKKDFYFICDCDYPKYKDIKKI